VGLESFDQERDSMKRILLTAMLSIAAVASARAADLPQPAPLPQAPVAYIPTVAPVYNWGGIYLGINGGYGFGQSAWTGGGLTTGDFDTSGFLVGGTLGANFQTDAFVFGLETDLDYTGITGSIANACLAGVALGPCQTANDWLGTLRGRIGYAADRVLFYGTAGGAYGDVKATAFGVTNSQTEFGWTAGAGVEAAIADNWTARVEYLYVDLGNASCGAACGGAPVSVSFTQSLVRAGVNFKFR
jgi:outer membrane immunogenic protein